MSDPVRDSVRMRVPATVLRLLTGALPLALTPVFVWLVAEGLLNFGGGEKDILLAVPWMLWSVIFFFHSMFFWYRGYPLAKALFGAMLGATGMVLVLGLILGVRGPQRLGIL